MRARNSGSFVWFGALCIIGAFFLCLGLNAAPGLLSSGNSYTPRIYDKGPSASFTYGKNDYWGEFTYHSPSGSTVTGKLTTDCCGSPHHYYFDRLSPYISHEPIYWKQGEPNYIYDSSGNVLFTITVVDNTDSVGILWVISVNAVDGGTFTRN